YMIRSDRTLAVRVSTYANVPDRVLARSAADVLELVRKGRVRYVVTCSPPADRPDPRPDDFRLVDDAVRAHPELFRLVGAFPLAVEYVNGIHGSSSGEVCVWEVAGPVEDGPPDIPVVVPTAGLVIRP